MTGFLDIVADRVVSTFGKGISDYTFVLPGKRASILLCKKISERLKEACWEPEFTTLTSLMSKASGLTHADDIVLLAILFNVCRDKIKEEFFSDDFDSFVSWGEILLADFSGIDNNLIEADKLFDNTKDLAEIDHRFDDDEINNETINTLKRHSQPKDAAYYKEFRKIWDKLYDIYSTYRKHLEGKNIGYSGMVCRKAVENLKANISSNSKNQAIKDNKKYIDNKNYIFVGFNTFSRSEFEFVKALNPKAIYWDGCDFFDDEKVNEALNPDGVASMIQKIGCEIEEVIKRTDDRKRNIEIVRCPTDIIQCKAVMNRLEKVNTEELKGVQTSSFNKPQGKVEESKPENDTVIVLADDSLLPVMLQSIPKNIPEVNITTGLPLSDSQAFVFYKVLESIISSGRKDIYKRNDILYFLTNSIFFPKWENDKKVCEFKKNMETNLAPFFSIEPIKESFFAQFFCNKDDKDFNVGKYLLDSLSVYTEIANDSDTTEMVMRMIKCIDSINVALKRYQISISPKLYLRILSRELSRKYTPYETEALSGIQITGILETRCQDFKNVYIISANDDTLPKISQLLSFIPMNLREAYNLPMSGDFQRMSASYFYHLLYRAKNVCILYNGNSTTSRTGEVSRFVRQIEYLTPKSTTLSYTSVSSKLLTEEFNNLDFRHSEETSKIFKESNISASMLTAYMGCQRRFALEHIHKLRPSDTILDDIKSSDIGTAIHKCLEVLCAPLEDNTPTYGNKRAKELFDNFDNEVIPIIEKYGIQPLKDKYLHKSESSDMKRLSEMIKIRVRQVLEYDSKDPETFQTEAVEKKIFNKLSVNNVTYNTKMVIDRLDRIGDKYRVVDYKTGKKDELKLGENEKDIDKIFEHDTEKKSNRAEKDPLFQTLFYGLNYKGKKWVPAIYSLPRISDEDYSPYPDKKNEPISPTVFGYYENNLKKLVEEIVSPDNNIEFRACKESTNSPCKLCDYRSLCGR